MSRLIAIEIFKKKKKIDRETQQVGEFVRTTPKCDTLTNLRVNVTHRGYRQCQRELCQIQRGLLRQYGNQLHEADQPAKLGDQGEGEFAHFHVN